MEDNKKKNKEKKKDPHQGSVAAENADLTVRLSFKLLR